MTAARLATAAIVAYQRVVSPWLPRACRFAPTCSEYARQAIAEHGVIQGGRLAAWRLMRCHPFNPGGYDPPPVRKRATT
jgi:putative membrane protein insertion efficiency factor